MSPMSNHLRLTLVSAFAGIALFGALALYLRRRKRKKASLYHEIYFDARTDEYPECNRPNSVDTSSVGSLRRRSPKVMDVNGGNGSNVLFICSSILGICIAPLQGTYSRVL